MPGGTGGEGVEKIKFSPKFNKIWFVSNSHEWLNIIKFQFQSKFQGFLYQTLCVF